MLAAFVSALHLLTLALGLGSVWLRGRALRRLADGGTDFAAAFRADLAWGIAALLWLATGLGRLFAQLDKGLDFYLYNGMFWVKMGLFALVFVLELYPMITLIRWRGLQAKQQSIDARPARLMWQLNHIEIVLVIAIPFVAAMMARGVWLLGGS
jgi:putative membrane protein